MIISVADANSLSNCAEVIRKAFQTVAVEYGFTKENNPTHPSFITSGLLQDMLARGIRMFAFNHQNKVAGFVAIENPEGDLWYIEKLAVIPELRHLGIGKRLMDHAIKTIKESGGSQISIALINSQTELKLWYEKLGFTTYLVKEYDHLPFDVCFMEMKLFQIRLVLSTNPVLAELIDLLDTDLNQRYNNAPIHGVNLQTANNSGIQFVIGYWGNQSVACGAIRPFDESHVELKRMFVRPEFRGRGYAKLVYIELERLAHDKGYSDIILETGKSQHEAIGLYTKLGFHPIPKFGEYVNDANSLCFGKQIQQSINSTT